MQKKVLLVAAARPNFMKVAPIYRELKNNDGVFAPVLVHTGQHYDLNMSDAFFSDLELPPPDIHLGTGSGTHAEQTAKVMVEMEKVCVNERPDWVLVVGDVNSTMASAITAAKLSIPVAHVEAGLRSRDKTMPEEINRLVTDSIADLLLTPSRDASENLLKEGHDGDKISLVGNVMIDSLEFVRPKVRTNGRSEQLGLKPHEYALLTLHRPSNVDDPVSLKNILDKIVTSSGDMDIVFPVHPRTEVTLRKSGALDGKRYGTLKFVEPLGYLDFIGMQMKAKFVVTDSGGVQEETTYLGVPCLTLRTTTERPVTITEGTNELVSPGSLAESIERIRRGLWKKGRIPEFWDGKTAQRIVEAITRSSLWQAERHGA
ncbi:MAG: UDP-N-acetylglucosamine 2-epimerase (non-hydrolyzing) [Deltaproteobacteria bacterium]|nr:UDP-N-acetylglucosamine 2-epimerase (non-hydrolyzing) [Deltaproteobacteria bacterium]